MNKGFTSTQTSAGYKAALSDAKGSPIQERVWGEWLPVESCGQNVHAAVAGVVRQALRATGARIERQACVISGRPVASLHVELQGQGMEAGFRGWTTTAWVLNLDLATREGITEAARWVGGDELALDALRDLWRISPAA